MNKEQLPEKKISKNTGLSNKMKAVTVGILTTLGTISSQAKAFNPTIMESEEVMTEMMFDNDNFPDSLIVAPNLPVFNNCHIDNGGTFIVNLNNLAPNDKNNFQLSTFYSQLKMVSLHFGSAKNIKTK